ncbi:hypothetical protein [Crystallibacter degradans]|uniref:hypothetical protein n=1 Tax=Crystallibacter degradans TaxID=2726743 RepID=UPI001472B1B8|nr:hypothetical protein [Arthrobacter sp. SF27]NMR32264.1 hypothetical protein [Arthrobacter sp. SF27]
MSPVKQQIGQKPLLTRRFVLPIMEIMSSKMGAVKEALGESVENSIAPLPFPKQLEGARAGRQLCFPGSLTRPATRYPLREPLQLNTDNGAYDMA